MKEGRNRLRGFSDRVKSLVPSLLSRAGRHEPDSGQRTDVVEPEFVPLRKRTITDLPEPTKEADESLEPFDHELEQYEQTDQPPASHEPFDRELKQYERAEQELASQEGELREKRNECRDGGDLLADFRRYEQQLRQVRQWQRKLVGGRKRYESTRNELAAWGPTDDWVVAGSIVTVRYLDGHRDTFVLTERHTDTEYETVSYDSPMGQAVRRRRVGDRVSLPAGAPLVVEQIRPGFRLAATSANQEETVTDTKRPPLQVRQIPTRATADEALALQRCRDKVYRDDLYKRRYSANVRALNEYVDNLRLQRRAVVPYVAPTYGGVDARLLTLMQDPGPKTDLSNTDGSGMLCVENTDLSAARQKFFLTEAGIDIADIVSWNAYPWPKPHPQTQETDRQAALTLRDFLALTPHIEVVILNGLVAKRIWRLLDEEIDPRAVEGIKPIPTFHTSERAINPDQKSSDYIEMVHNDLSAKYAAAARQLYGSTAWDARTP